MFDFVYIFFVLVCYFDSFIFQVFTNFSFYRRRKRKAEPEIMAADNCDLKPNQVPIRDYFKPVVDKCYSGIAFKPVNVSFELRPSLISLVQQNQFGGSPIEDPYVHLRTFLEIADTVRINGVPQDTVRLRLFSFSLRDKARDWLQSLPLGSIQTWEQLATKFLEKYFPPAKSAQLRSAISTFQQLEIENLYEAWE